MFTEEEKIFLIRGIDLQISQSSSAILQSQKREEKTAGRETISYLNDLIGKVEKLEETKEDKKK